MSTILVVAPHPDDETLGCGGTLLRHSSQGDELHWLIMTGIDGKAESEKQIKLDREKEISKITKEFGFKSTHQTEFISCMLDTVPKKKLVDSISVVLNETKPDTLYVPFRNDSHSDHKCVFDAVASCTKSFRYPFLKKVMAYETISETEFSVDPNELSFRPNLWVDISSYLDQKIKIMSIYESEIGPHPFPRSKENIRALATFRGATVNLKYAEAFIIIKEII